MDIDSFKQQFATELAGLTPARISTLWKKSKTLSSAELLDAIVHSKAMMEKDKARRGKDAGHESEDAKMAVQPATVTVVADTVAHVASSESQHISVEVPDMHLATEPDWTTTCSRVGVDHGELMIAIGKLRETIRSRGGTKAEERITKLYSTVSDLLALRERCGKPIDVIGLLRL